MMLDRAGQLLIILLIEAAVGFPEALYRWVRHPVVWIGALIGGVDAKWNAGSFARRRVAGCALVVVLLVVSGGAGVLVNWVAAQARAPSMDLPACVSQPGLRACGPAPGVSPEFHFPVGDGFATLLVILIATTGLAQRSLRDHVVAVSRPLQAGDLGAARVAVARIVGRDTETLDAEGVSAAAIESLAESFCDGIVAPAFWFLVAGLPGLFICKAINTADSIVGHKDARHRAFGWAAARADDVMNWLPARLAGLFICIAGIGSPVATAGDAGRVRALLNGLRTMLRDAHKHASPNAGWPEAAMAGVLSRQLGGPVSYDGELTDRPVFGTGPHPNAASLRTALSVYWRACALLWLFVAAIAWAA
ncbi:MAG: CobD/CbiB family cobalamin biosynthesis protein [Gammaproteobacteria bacterium]